LADDFQPGLQLGEGQVFDFGHTILLWVRLARLSSAFPVEKYRDLSAQAYLDLKLKRFTARM
jgi:hypothetical protein